MAATSGLVIIGDGRYLGMALPTINLLNGQMVVLGGGVIEASEVRLRQRLRKLSVVRSPALRRLPDRLPVHWGRQKGHGSSVIARDMRRLKPFSEDSLQTLRLC